MTIDPPAETSEEKKKEDTVDTSVLDEGDYDANLPKFERASKRIASPDQILKFKASPAFKTLTKFIVDLAASVKSKTNSAKKQISRNTKTILAMLAKFDKLVDDVPPRRQKMRYGNTAFRDWWQKFEDMAREAQEPLLSSGLKKRGALDEITPYLLDSFGNATRIDYGTGHELHFVAWLCCLTEMGVFVKADFQALVTDVFNQYILLCRKIQSTYLLEPAGSKGVWCLDDYQFLPFYLGAAQLVNHPEITPSQVLDKYAQDQSEEYLYLSGIKFINKMKTGPFHEHSPFLTDAMRAPSWKKVQAGLFRMFHDHVLEKYPVIQHFLFGTVLSINLPSRDFQKNRRTAQKANAALAAASKRPNAKGLMPDDPDPVSGVVPWEAVPDSGVATVPVTGVAPWAMSSSDKATKLAKINALNAKLRAQRKPGARGFGRSLQPPPWAQPNKKAKTEPSPAAEEKKAEEADGAPAAASAEPQKFDNTPIGRKLAGPREFEKGSIKRLAETRPRILQDPANPE